MAPTRYLGLDIGGTKSAAIIGTADGQIIDRVQFCLRSETRTGGDDRRIVFRRGTTSSRHTERSQLPAVSIGGASGCSAGNHSRPAKPSGMDGAAAQSDSARNASSCRCELSMMRRRVCLAEYRWGAGQNATRLIYLTCGNWLWRGGWCFDGKRVSRCGWGAASEVGHARLREGRSDRLRQNAVVPRHFCAASALGRNRMLGDFPSDGPRRCRRMRSCNWPPAGVPEALAVVQINAHAVGDVCSTLGDLLRPDAILLGSSARYFGDRWLSDVRGTICGRDALPRLPQNCRIDPAGLGDRFAGLLGTGRGNCLKRSEVTSDSFFSSRSDEPSSSLI